MPVYTSSAFIRVYIFIHTLHTQKRINHIQTQLSVCIFWYFCSGYVLLLLYYYMRSHFHSYVSNATWKLWNTDFHSKICPPFLVVIVNKSLHFYCSQFFTKKKKIYIYITHASRATGNQKESCKEVWLYQDSGYHYDYAIYWLTLGFISFSKQGLWTHQSLRLLVLQTTSVWMWNFNPSIPGY